MLVAIIAATRATGIECLYQFGPSSLFVKNSMDQEPRVAEGGGRRGVAARASPREWFEAF